jgi:hypothetical protein
MDRGWKDLGNSRSPTVENEEKVYKKIPGRPSK